MLPQCVQLAGSRPGLAREERYNLYSAAAVRPTGRKDLAKALYVPFNVVVARMHAHV